MSNFVFFIYINSITNYVIIKCISNEGFKFVTSTAFSLPRHPLYTVFLSFQKNPRQWLVSDELVLPFGIGRRQHNPSSR